MRADGKRVTLQDDLCVARVVFRNRLAIIPDSSDFKVDFC